MSQNSSTLKEYLSRYNEFTVPDYYFCTWRILFQGTEYLDRREILGQAEKDMQDEISHRPMKLFNSNRRQMEGTVALKLNWDGK